MNKNFNKNPHSIQHNTQLFPRTPMFYRTDLLYSTVQLSVKKHKTSSLHWIDKQLVIWTLFNRSCNSSNRRICRFSPSSRSDGQAVSKISTAWRQAMKACFLAWISFLYAFRSTTLLQICLISCKIIIFITWSISVSISFNNPFDKHKGQTSIDKHIKIKYFTRIKINFAKIK